MLCIHRTGKDHVTVSTKVVSCLKLFLIVKWFEMCRIERESALWLCCVDLWVF